VHAVVLVSRVNAPVVQAIAYARATRPSSLVALHVQTDRSDVDALMREWDSRRMPIPLTVVESPYRDVTNPVIDYVRSLRSQNPRELVAVFIPEYVVTHWWETLLHNQSALRLKARLLFLPRVISVSVPHLLHPADDEQLPPAKETALGPLPAESEPAVDSAADGRRPTATLSR
jgi:hypothetical protein